MTQERDSILDGFRNGKTKVLITTNVIARGIDILQVNMVVNYDVPDMGPEGGFRPDIETYIHRIGQLAHSDSCTKLIADRQDRSIWPQGLLSHLCARPTLPGRRAGDHPDAWQTYEAHRCIQQNGPGRPREGKSAT